MKKVFAIITALILSMAVLTACGETKTIDVKAAADALKNNITYEDELNVLSAEMLLSTYTDLDTEDVAAAQVYTSSTATAEEIAVFEAKDAAAADRIEQVMQNRIDSQKELYASYAPDEVKRLEGAVLTKKGNYVVLCVAGDSSLAEKEVKKLFE